MSIDVPTLDNRRFQDIVDDAKRKIPEYFPAWTNHNLSDPGVALIELFAWMTESTLFQLNQLPDKAMRTLLDAVGFELFPPQSATAELTFYTSRPAVVTGVPGEIPPPVKIPARTTVGTEGGRDRVIFETEHELVLNQPILLTCATQRTDGTANVRAEALDETRTHPLQFDEPVVCFEGLDAARHGWDTEYEAVDPLRRQYWKPHRRFSGDAIYFGFRDRLAGALVRADVQAASDGLGIDPNNPPLVWEASTDQGFARCDVVFDGTGGLNRDGKVDIQVPAGHRRSKSPISNEDLYWLALRVDHERCPIYQRSPRITAISFETIGGVVTAVNAQQQDPTVLGFSNGRPGQRFHVDDTLVGGDDQFIVEVGGVRWAHRADFSNATDESPVFVVDIVAGDVAFGPEVREADGTTTQHGAIPLEGLPIVAQYRTGGGAVDIEPDQIRNLRTSVAYVDRVTNRKPVRGGADAETIDMALERAPSSVRAGDRAVTTEDCVRIVHDAVTGLPNVACREPTRAGDPVRVLIVPPVTTHPSVQRLDDYVLSERLHKKISDYLEPRRLVGSRFELTTPKFLGVHVTTQIRCAKSFDHEAVEKTVTDLLYRFINPIVGGERGRGLQLGETLTRERVKSMLAAIDGVRKIDLVELFEADLRTKRRIGAATRRIEIPDDTVMLSFRHHVIVEREDEV